jgi:probable HAF family extracellular repeat protein
MTTYFFIPAMLRVNCARLCGQRDIMKGVPMFSSIFVPPRTLSNNNSKLHSARRMAALGLFAAFGTVQAATAYTVTQITPNGTASYYSTAYAVNEIGQVTGSAPFDGHTHAFLYDGTTVRDLGTLGGNNYSYGAAINSSGQITGLADTASGNWHAYLYDGTAMKDIDPLGSYSLGRAINDDGKVTGYAARSNGSLHAFLFDGVSLQDLGTLGGTTSYGTKINAKGQVAGDAQIASNTNYAIYHAFLYDGSAMRDLGTLGGISSGTNALNDKGQVAGYSFTANGDQHPFLYDGKTMLDLGTLGGKYGSAYAINKKGEVAGSASLVGDTDSHAFYYDGKTMRDLGTLGGNYSTASAINAAVQIVGNASTGPETHAFVWSSANGMVDLNTTLVNAPAGLVLTDASAISDSGYIIATSNTGAVLLTPTKKP